MHPPAARDPLLPPSSARMPGVFVARSAAGLVALVVLALVVGLLVGTAPVRALDQAVADGLTGVAALHPWSVGALLVVTSLGETVTAVIVLATLATALLIRRQPALAGYVVATGLGALVLVPVVKVLVGRLRPIVPTPVAAAGGPSFPSGHTVSVTVLIGVLVLVALPVLPARARRAVVTAGVLVVALVGFTRLALGLHFLSDVVAGWLIGAAWLVVTAEAFRVLRRRAGHREVGLHRGVDPEAAGDLVPAPEHDPRTPHVFARATQGLVAAVLLLGVMAGIGTVVAAQGPGTWLGRTDIGVVRWFAERRTPVLDALSYPAAEAGNTGVVIVVGLVVCVLALAVLRRWWPVVLVAVALTGELLIFLGAVAVAGRPRPQVVHLDSALPPTSSFPSGHTGAAVALYGAIVLVVFASTRAWWRRLVLVLAVVVVVLVAVARLYRGAHHPADVVGSLLLAGPWLAVTWALVRPPGHRRLQGQAAGSAQRGAEPGTGMSVDQDGARVLGPDEDTVGRRR